jgi:hypothetical protein
MEKRVAQRKHCLKETRADRRSLRFETTGEAIGTNTNFYEVPILNAGNYR